ncbi:MAG: toxin TcdB middle/N-terminal domain-containing protein [Bradymonadia bacterium]
MRWLRPIAFTLISSTPVLAQTGVSDDRVSLPEGPGSLEGIGDNAGISASRGAMNFAVGIDVPAGFPGITPNLSIAYNSGGSAGIMGIGWDMSVPFMERMTQWGLPKYTADDDFVANGGDQLVHVGEGVYRARIEGGFVRYLWIDRGDGTQGYWVAEQPDGIKMYFGATADGDLVDNARVSGRDGATFRYQLVEIVDSFDHRAHYSYQLRDGLPYLDSIEYTFVNGEARSKVTFEYEDRPDPLSDARSGANELISQRLAAVNVYSKETRMWRYDLGYEDEAISGGLSRLASLQRFGLNDEPHPVSYNFGYSKTLGAQCDTDGGVGCEDPYLVDMGSIGVGLSTGAATLVDLDGDALPDIVDTSRSGAHRIYKNQYTTDSHSFSAAIESATGDQNGHQLSSAYVQVLDANGDGRADMINVRTGEILYNLGEGDWSTVESLGGTASLPDFGDDFAGGDAELSNIRFLDYNNDRLIDVISSTFDTTQVYENQGESGFAIADGVEAIGSGFADSRLEMADMNGDGLQDPVILAPGQLTYRLNLGYGRWSSERVINDLPFNEAQIEFVELQDINGDSLDDLVIVLSDQLSFALNRAGDHFDDATVINSVGGQALPQRIDNTTVLFADMNGSGSDDVVWVTADGDVTYLELFPTRPNLLTEITNGLGLVTEVTYATSVQQMAAAEAAGEEKWAYTLPFAMIMADSIDTYDNYNGEHKRVSYTYRDAFYDTVEKQFRGFAEVSLTTEADDAQEGGMRVQRYDVGDTNRYLAGALMATEDYAISNGEAVPLMTTELAYDDCDVDEVPADTSWPVRYMCVVARENTMQERQSASAWVKTRVEYSYDGYGQVTETAQLGVIGIGDGACPAKTGQGYGAPSGENCEGDEMYITTEYATSDDWLLNLPARVSTAAERNSAASFGGEAQVTEFLYDGDDYAGLPVGQATIGLRKHARSQLSDGEWISTGRFRHDSDGNVVETWGPQATEGNGAYRIRESFDEEGLLVTASEQVLLDPEGQPYSLMREFTYDDIWGTVTGASSEITIVDGSAVTEATWSQVVYDNLGRVAARYRHGDPDGRPTVEYTYEYGDPVSALTQQFRSEQGAALPDRQVVSCLDGQGREIASLARVASGMYEASDYAIFNNQGALTAKYRTHTVADGACPNTPPELTPLRTTFDALGREISVVRTDASIFGEASFSRREYLPLSVAFHDVSDTDAASPFADTPTIRVQDGLGRDVSVEYTLTSGGESLVYSFEYDVRGRLAAVVSPAGERTTYTRDRLGRVVESASVDRGTQTFVYNEASQLVSETDATGRTVERSYDARGRLTGVWDAADPEGTLVQALYDLPSACPDDLCPNASGHRVGTLFPTHAGEGARWFTHDDRGRLVNTRTVIDGVPFELRVEFSNLDRETAMVMPDGTRLEFTRDGIDRVTAIEGFVDSATFTRSSLLDTMRLSNGVTVEMGYNAADLLDSQRVTGAEGALLDLGYTRNRFGYVTGIDDLQPVDGLAGQGALYTYDALNRLASATLDPAREAFEETITYGYDNRQNLVQRASTNTESASHLGALTYGADKPHAVISAGDRTFEYDAAGMMTQSGDNSLTWDHNGRLKAVQTPEGESRFWYAIETDRVIAEEGAHLRYAVSRHFEIEDGMAVTHVYLGSRHVASHETDALATAIFGDPAADDALNAGDAIALGGADDEATRRLLMASARAKTLQGEARVIFTHHDHTGNTVLTTDAAGEVVDRFAFDPHGVLRSGDDNSDARKAVDGFQRDSSTGLTQMGMRYADTALGRWTSPDPLFKGEPGAVAMSRPMEASNPYMFNLNNPVQFQDPTGLLGVHELGGQPAELARDNLTDQEINDMDWTGDHDGDIQTFEDAVTETETGLDESVRQLSRMQQSRAFDAEAAQNGLNNLDQMGAVGEEATQLRAEYQRTLNAAANPSQAETNLATQIRDARNTIAELRRRAQVARNAQNRQRNRVQAPPRGQPGAANGGVVAQPGAARNVAANRRVPPPPRRHYAAGRNAPAGPGAAAPPPPPPRNNGGNNGNNGGGAAAQPGAAPQGRARANNVNG